MYIFLSDWEQAGNVLSADSVYVSWRFENIYMHSKRTYVYVCIRLYLTNRRHMYTNKIKYEFNNRLLAQ